VVGNSGSGKDSIISGSLQKYPPNLKPIHVAKRFITREASEFEDNYTITLEQFKELEEEGKFALKWQIYGLNYGVPIEIDEWLKEGHVVIVNVSRTIIEKARKEYKNMKIIFIQVPWQTTVDRIKQRGREKGEILEQRIERARINQEFPEADFVVDNSSTLESAISQFLEYIENID